LNLTGYYYALCVLFCLSAFSRSHCMCVVYTFSSSLVCTYIHVCVYCPLFSIFPADSVYSSSVILGYFQPERGALAAWSPAVRTVKCVEGVTRDRRRQGSANVESNDGALSILFLFQKERKNSAAPLFD
jgi:hypothetical protein